MARSVNRLSTLKVGRSLNAGKYPDGLGLYLQVTSDGAKSWIFRFTLNGRAREMGLGPLSAVTLAEARQLATKCRQRCAAGVDPIEARKAERKQAAVKAASTVTFRQAAEAFIRANAPGWSNHKHTAQWTATLAAYAFPVLGDLPVEAIETDHIVKVLEPIWTEKPETARRVRGRIEAILDRERVLKHRQGENPARWRGHLNAIFPPRARVRPVKHHPALPYQQIGQFMAQLRQMPGVSPRGLEFLILTALRTEAVLGARWDEFDLENRVWTVPGARMKGGREHRVPLSAAAMAVLAERAAQRVNEFVFPGAKKGQPLSNGAFLATLKRMGRTDITPHGFRSTCRDWAAEQTNHSHEVAEMVLAHTISSRVEAAYRRGELFGKRRELMEDWAKACSTPSPADLRLIA